MSNEENKAQVSYTDWVPLLYLKMCWVINGFTKFFFGDLAHLGVVSQHKARYYLAAVYVCAFYAGLLQSWLISLS